jgi:hypothetical protein
MAREKLRQPAFAPPLALVTRLHNLTLSGLILLLCSAVGNNVLALTRSNPAFPDLVDDAFIHLRFAHHLAQGLGLVWNPGEAPVEGFTSPLYVVLLAALEKAGFSPIALIPVLGTGATLVILLLSWNLGARLNPARPIENLLALILTCISPPVLYWQTAGLEIPLYTALLIAAALSYLSYRQHAILTGWVGVLFAITALTRPEGLLLFGVTLAFEGLIRLLKRQRLFDQPLLMMIVGFMCFYVPVFFWKWAYFGELLPNTYYAKTGGGLTQIMGGLTYVVKNFLYYIFPATVVPLALFVVRLSRMGWPKKFAFERMYVVVLATSILGLCVINGGDHFPLGRFFAPAIPLVFVVTSASGLSDLFDDDAQAALLRPVFLAVSLGLAIVYWQPWNVAQQQRTISIPLANPARQEHLPSWETGFILMGRTLPTIASADDSIAAVPIGAIGYYSNLKVIDMVGLVDPVIAHEPFDPVYSATWRPGHDKGDGQYVLSQQPDYIQLIDLLTSQPMPEPDAHALQYKSIVEIWSSPLFHSLYEFYPVQTTGGWYYNLYRRIDSPAVTQPR